MRGSMKTIVLTGGGTAGHVMPNLALLPNLRKHFERIVYIGTENGIEKGLVGDKLEYKSISACKLIRKLTLSNFAIPFKLLKSIKEAKKILKEIKPNIVFSKGGFVAVPVVIAARQLKIPVVSHESDMTLGLANKIIYKFCNRMCLSFEPKKLKKKCVFTGSPIRDDICYGRKEDTKIHFTNNNKTILFFGGSLGAKPINDAVFSSLDTLTKYYNVIHIVGKGNAKNTTAKNYIQKEFVNNIGDYYALCDMVVCRSGANTLFELLKIKKPMLLIPLSKAQSRGDQIENANYFEEKGFAIVLPQEKLCKEILINKIKALDKLSNALISDMLKYKIKDSNKIIVDLIVSEML